MTLELPGIRFSTQFDPPWLSGTSARCFDQNFRLLTFSVANHDFFLSIWLFWKIIELSKIVALLNPFYDKIWFHLNFITFNCPWKDLKNRQLAVEKPLLEALFAELKTKTSEEKTKNNQHWHQTSVILMKFRTTMGNQTDLRIEFLASPGFRGCI